jgi:hypothetical protein
MSYNYSNINTKDQAMLKADNSKICNKNCDKACTDLKLREKENRVHENPCIGLN